MDADALDQAERRTWLVFTDPAGVAARAVARLRAAGHRVVTVQAGDSFARTGEDDFVISPERGREDYDRLLHELVAHGLAPQRIAHFWLVTDAETFRPGSSFFHRNQEQGFWSLLFLSQALAEENLPRPIHIAAFTTGAARVKSERLAYPDKATLQGPLRVIPREFPGVTCSSLDLTLPGKAGLDALTDRIIEELLAEPANLTAALRGDRRYELVQRPLALPAAAAPLPQGAAVLVTGGFGGIGLTLAERLVTQLGARIALLPTFPKWCAV